MAQVTEQVACSVRYAPVPPLHAKRQAMYLEIPLTTGVYVWLALSFLAAAGGVTYCVAYLNKGDDGPT